MSVTCVHLIQDCNSLSCLWMCLVILVTDAQVCGYKSKRSRPYFCSGTDNIEILNLFVIL